MRIHRHLLVLAVVPFLPVRAQGRVLTLPDTLGANFSIADSATAAGTPEDYDHFLGVWHFRFQQRRPDGTYNPPFTGHWTFRKRHGERPVIEDYWRVDDPSSSFDAGTSTYRAWNPTRKLWEYRGTSTYSNETWQPGLSWSDRGNRYLFQRTGPRSIVRFRYFAIEEDRFLWRADMSADDGATWTRDWWVMNLERVGR